MAYGGDKVFLPKDADSESDSPRQSGDNNLSLIRDLLIARNSQGSVQPAAAEPDASGSETESSQSESQSTSSSNRFDDNLRQALDLLAQYLGSRNPDSIPCSDGSRLLEIIEQLRNVDSGTSFSYSEITPLSDYAAAFVEESASANEGVRFCFKEILKLANQIDPNFPVKPSSPCRSDANSLEDISSIANSEDDA